MGNCGVFQYPDLVKRCFDSINNQTQWSFREEEHVEFALADGMSIDNR